MSKIKTFYKNPLAYYEIAYFLKSHLDNDTIIICIGTDRCIGDCLGPLTGTILKHNNFPLPVYGTIDEPIHALNLDKKLDDIKTIHPKSKILGIDACLGNSSSIGELQARDYPIHPGKGVGKSLPNVGNTSIIGIVDSSDSTEIFANRNIRLNLILDMSKVVCNALLHSYYLFNSNLTN